MRRGPAVRRRHTTVSHIIASAGSVRRGQEVASEQVTTSGRITLNRAVERAHGGVRAPRNPWRRLYALRPGAMKPNSWQWTIALFFGCAIIFGVLRRVTQGHGAGVTLL